MNDVKLIGEIIDIYDVATYNNVDYVKAELKITRRYNDKLYEDFVPISFKGDIVQKLMFIGPGSHVIVSGSLSRKEFIDKESRETKKNKMEVSVFFIEKLEK